MRLKRRLVYTTEVERDADAVFAHVAIYSASAAHRLRDEYLNTLLMLLDTPQLGHEHASVQNRGYLCVSVGSYLFFYRYDDETLTAIRLIHASRDLRSLL